MNFNSEELFKTEIPPPAIQPHIMTRYQFDNMCKLLKIKDKELFKKELNIVIDERIPDMEGSD